MSGTALPLDTTTRIAEIRQENRGGDVSYRDIEWLCSTVERLTAAMRHVVGDSPGTPDSVKKYLVRELEGSWGDAYEQAVIAGPPEGYI